MAIGDLLVMVVLSSSRLETRMGKHEVRMHKADTKVNVSLFLLGAAFTFFIFTVNINPDLLRDNIFLALQITLSIPLLMTSVFVRSKTAHSSSPKRWYLYGFITFILGYGFLINVIGIILWSIIGVTGGIIYFSLNVVSSLVYSIVGASNGSKSFVYLFKNALYILIILLGGVLPSIVGFLTI